MLCGFVGSVDGLCGVLEHAVSRVCRVIRVVDFGSVMLAIQVDVAEFGRKSRAVQRARVRARNLRARGWLAYHGTVAEWLHLILEASDGRSHGYTRSNGRGSRSGVGKAGVGQDGTTRHAWCSSQSQAHVAHETER